MSYTIRTDYHAYHHSGNRPLSAIEWFVIHSIETTNMTGGAEGAASWLSQSASGGSAHFCIDNDSIQRILPLTVVAWGAPGANDNGVHYELAGRAAWTRQQWLSKARGTIERTAWLLARNHAYLLDHGVRVPLVKLSDASMREHRHGVVTHRQVTRVTGVGSHWDPGEGFPMAYLMDRAREYARR